MPEARPSERRPIVPDPESSLTRPHRYHVRQPRLWPLKFAVLLLLAMLLGVTWLGWMERERLSAQMHQVASEMSNVHARFDAEEGRGDRLETIEARIASVEDHAQSIVARMAGLEVELQQADEQDGTRYAALDELTAELTARLERLVQEAEDREALIEAVRVSLDALERSGEQGREALAARIDTLAEAHERQTQRLAEGQALQDELAESMQSVRTSFDQRLNSVDEQVQELMAQNAAAMEERLASLADDVEALAAEDTSALAVDELRARLVSMEGELRELRQEQLSLSAGLEALR